VTADRRARLLTNKPQRLRKLIPGNPLWSVMIDYLRQGLSPAQIQSTLSRMPDPVQLSYETIYTALYTMPRGHLRSSLLVLMRHRRHARRPRRSKDGRSKPMCAGFAENVPGASSGWTI
jgi:IS30 family transposase